MEGTPDFVPGFVFDARFYVARHADIAAIVARGDGFDPRQHFLTHGIAEGRAASIYFDVAYVHEHLRRFEEIAVERAGATAAFFALPPERRFVPNRWFNPWLLRRRHGAAHPALATMDDYAAFAFYAEHAATLRLSPHGLFDEPRYLDRYPDVAAAVASGAFRSGFHHFVSLGCSEGRENLPDFGVWFIAEAERGRAEGHHLLRAPDDLGRVVWWFDAPFYLAANPPAHALVRSGAMRSGLEHFLALGIAEARAPHPALAGIAAGDAASFFAALREQAPDGRPPVLAVADASALARRVLARGEVASPRAIADAIWPFVAPPPIAAGAAGDPFAGRRLSPADLAAGAGGVNFFGPLALADAAGAAARGTLDALRRAGVEADAYDISGFVRAGAGFDLVAADDLRFAFNLVFLNPDQVLPFAARYGMAMFDRRASVGFWAWELPTPRPEWRAALGGFDLIVTPSTGCAGAFASETARPIATVPYVVDHAALRAARDAYRGHPAIDRLIDARKAGRRIVLLVTDDADSARQGVDVFEAVAAGFERRFPDRALFVLKTPARGRPNARRPEMAPVMVIDDRLDLPALCKLRSIADAFVSPHRAEAFGADIFAAIALGVPAFCSRHGGGIGLLGEDYPYFLPGRLAELRADRGAYRRGAVWFEPDPAAAVAALARFFEAPQAEREAFDAIAARLVRALSPGAVGQRLVRVLRERLGFGADPSAVRAALRARAPERFAIGPSAVAARQPRRAREALAAAVSPFFTIITTTFDTDPTWVREFYEDLCAQTDPAWEWCINDDCSTDPRTRAALAGLRARDARVRVRFARGHEGTARAVNAAVTLSCGAHLVMIDASDRVAPELLASYRAAIAKLPSPALFYCDEDKPAFDSERRAHFYKPDFSHEYLISAMYVRHGMCVQKSLFLELGGYRDEYPGAEDHDFVLRLAAAGTPIGHVDRLLYHGREGSGREGSAAATGTAIDAARGAVADYACRIGLDATVEHGLAPGTYRVRPRVPPGRVSLNILTGGMAGRIGERREVFVENFIRSITRFGTGSGTDTGIDVEIRVIVDADAHDAVAALPLLDERVTLVPYDRGEAPFNFAHKANAAVHRADAERIVLLNDDMEALDGEWLRALLEVLEIPGVGIAGGRLLYPDDTVQHCGIALGVLGAGAHVLVGLPKQAPGYNLFGHVIRNYSAVTGACMAFRRSVFEAVGGFDESYPLDFNDVDFCLKVGEAGWRVVYTPFATLRHFESRSAKRMAFDALDQHRLMRRWEAMIRRDPFYNVNLRRDSQHFRALEEA